MYLYLYVFVLVEDASLGRGGGGGVHSPLSWSHPKIVCFMAYTSELIGGWYLTTPSFMCSYVYLLILYYSIWWKLKIIYFIYVLQCAYLATDISAPETMANPRQLQWRLSAPSGGQNYPSPASVGAPCVHLQVTLLLAWSASLSWLVIFTYVAIELFNFLMNVWLRKMMTDWNRLLEIHIVEEGRM